MERHPFTNAHTHADTHSNANTISIYANGIIELLTREISREIPQDNSESIEQETSTQGELFDEWHENFKASRPGVEFPPDQLKYLSEYFSIRLAINTSGPSDDLTDLINQFDRRLDLETFADDPTFVAALTQMTRGGKSKA